MKIFTIFPTVIFVFVTPAGAGKLDDAFGKLTKDFNASAPMPAQRTTTFTPGKIQNNLTPPGISSNPAPQVITTEIPSTYAIENVVISPGMLRKAD